MTVRRRRAVCNQIIRDINGKACGKAYMCFFKHKGVLCRCDFNDEWDEGEYACIVYFDTFNPAKMQVWGYRPDFGFEIISEAPVK
ncbi:MAG: hypothetical protein J6Y83_04850 [Bacteroidales bacterium]|nr:hypothetical protein [Bacteroidales bacterium]